MKVKTASQRMSASTPYSNPKHKGFLQYKEVKVKTKNGEQIKQQWGEFETEEIDPRLKFRDFDVDTSVENNFNLGEQKIYFQTDINAIDRMGHEVEELGEELDTKQAELEYQKRLNEYNKQEKVESNE